jgi:hypothetical protein
LDKSPDDIKRERIMTDTAQAATQRHHSRGVAIIATGLAAARVKGIEGTLS